MKAFFRNSISFCLALLVLFSTLSFTVSQHFCGDTLVDTAIFTNVKGCGMEEYNTSNQRILIEKSDCCNDFTQLIEGQEDLQTPAFDSVFQQQFLISFVYSYQFLFLNEIDNKTPFSSYLPPSIVKDLHILDETFLI